nr:uncharacterized protein LOC109157058 [Ipomoea batatas]
MENSKTISAQRYTEDLDLLERSTKKSKHNDGDPSPSAMEIVVVPETVDATGNPGMGSVEVVAKTPLEEQEAINHVEPEMEILGSGTKTAPFLIANLEDEHAEDKDEESNTSGIDEDPTYPTIRLSAEENKRIRELWRQTLIIKESCPSLVIADEKDVPVQSGDGTSHNTNQGRVVRTYDVPEKKGSDVIKSKEVVFHDFQWQKAWTLPPGRYRDVLLTSRRLSVKVYLHGRGSPYHAYDSCN